MVLYDVPKCFVDVSHAPLTLLNSPPTFFEEALTFYDTSATHSEIPIMHETEKKILKI
jgi:hypothetical protein